VSLLTPKDQESESELLYYGTPMLTCIYCRTETGYRDLLGGAAAGARDGGNAPSGGKVVGNEVSAKSGSGARELQPTATA
jgi:hypothetical protein